jgi:hypothetical protein
LSFSVFMHKSMKYLNICSLRKLYHGYGVNYSNLLVYMINKVKALHTHISGY